MAHYGRSALLCTGAANAASASRIALVAAKLARIADPAVSPAGERADIRGRSEPPRTGSRVAVGEARAGFPHYHILALPTLLLAREVDSRTNNTFASAHLDDGASTTPPFSIEAG